MARITFLLMIVSVVLLTNTHNLRAGGNNIVKRENGIYYIEVSGQPYEMGKRHGNLLAREIRHSVVDYKSNVEKQFGKKNAAKIFDWVLNKAKFKRDIKKQLPDVWQELEGIADGAGVSMDDVLLINMFEEVYEAGPMKVGLKAADKPGQGCTAFTAASAGKRFAGQNMDYSGNLQGKQLVIRYKRPNRQLLVYCFVGQVGGMGANSKGLSVFVNTLPQGKKRDEDGLGSNFVLRALLEQESVDKALATLKKLPRFGGTNFTLTDHRKGMVCETDANEVIPRQQSEKTGAVVGTNHCLHLKHRHDILGVYEKGQPVPYSVSLTLERMGSAKRQLRAAKQNLGIAKIKHMLTTTPINIYQPSFMTLQSGIAVHDSKTVTFYVSAGYDPLRKWNVLHFGK